MKAYADISTLEIWEWVQYNLDLLEKHHEHFKGAAFVELRLEAKLEVLDDIVDFLRDLDGEAKTLEAKQ